MRVEKLRVRVTLLDRPTFPTLLPVGGLLSEGGGQPRLAFHTEHTFACREVPIFFEHIH